MRSGGIVSRRYCFALRQMLRMVALVWWTRALLKTEYTESRMTFIT